MAAGVEVSGAAVSVSMWSARAAPAPAGKVSHPAQLVIMGGVNVGLSG